MALGSWDPGLEQSTSGFTIDNTVLEHFIALADQLDQLATVLSADEQQLHAPLMQQDQQAWTSAAEGISDEDILKLIRFFTVAEKIPGWEAGEKSPVIYLARALKKRGQKIDRELLLWIKAHSDNHFLPYGPL
jgi:hypothetical protein